MTDDKIKRRLERIEEALARIEAKLAQVPVGSNAVTPVWRKDALTRS